MQMRCDGFNGAPGVPTPCPNLRENVTVSYRKDLKVEKEK